MGDPMLDQSVTSYGVTETHQGADAFDAMAEELTRVGYTMLDSGLDSERIGLLRERLPRIYERQAAELRAAPLEQSDDSGVVRCPLAYDESFLELATSPRLLE